MPRPLGSKNKRKEKTVVAGKFAGQEILHVVDLPKDMEKINELIAKEPKDGIEKSLTCLCCGKLLPESRFFLNKASILFTQTLNRIPYCRDCLENLFRYYSSQFGQTEAIIMLCAICDLEYNKAQVEKAYSGTIFKFGEFVRQCSRSTSRGRATFINTFIGNGELTPKKLQKLPDVDVKWSKVDRRAKSYVLNKLGYDPFEPFKLDETDNKIAYNLMSGYLEDESIVHDPYKTQAIVTIVITTIQCNKIETLLAAECKRTPPDANKIKSLGMSKKDLQMILSKVAMDNNISSKYQKENNSTQPHLATKMKEMSDAGYWESKPNMFDVRTADAMRQVFDLSHQSIISQLELDGSEYALMVKDQRELIVSLQEERDMLEEENRNLHNRILAMESGDK